MTGYAKCVWALVNARGVAFEDLLVGTAIKALKRPTLAEPRRKVLATRATVHVAIYADALSPSPK